MVYQEELHNGLLVVFNRIRLGIDDHTFGRHRRTRRSKTLASAHFDLDQTHPAVRRSGQTLVVAVMGDVDTVILRHLQDIPPGRDLGLFAI